VTCVCFLSVRGATDCGSIDEWEGAARTPLRFLDGQVLIARGSPQHALLLTRGRVKWLRSETRPNVVLALSRTWEILARWRFLDVGTHSAPCNSIGAWRSGPRRRAGFWVFCKRQASVSGGASTGDESAVGGRKADSHGLWYRARAWASAWPRCPLAAALSDQCGVQTAR